MSWCQRPSEHGSPIALSKCIALQCTAMGVTAIDLHEIASTSKWQTLVLLWLAWLAWKSPCLRLLPG